MDKIELARKALLDTIGTGVSFPCSLSGYGGGACGDGYTGDGELYLNREELLYLISDGSEVFNGLEVKKVDVEDRLYEMAKDACWPDDNGGPSVFLSESDTVPSELKELAEMIEKHDEDDAEEVADLRARVAALQDGDYTFYVTIMETDYYFAENEAETFHLTADQVRGFLKNALYGADDIFDGICDKELDEDDFSDLAKKAGIGSEYVDDDWSYSGECTYLENYVEAWKTLIGKILSGEVDESNLNKWLAFFDNRDEWESGIDFFVKYNRAD